jgi:hypothetical protein
VDLQFPVQMPLVSQLPVSVEVHLGGQLAQLGGQLAQLGGQLAQLGGQLAHLHVPSSAHVPVPFLHFPVHGFLKYKTIMTTRPIKISPANTYPGHHGLNTLERDVVFVGSETPGDLYIESILFF